VILDVVLSLTAGGSPLEPTTEIPGVSPTASHITRSTMDLEQEMMQRLASTLTYEIPAQLGSNFNGYSFIAQAIKDDKLDSSDVIKKCLQELKSEMSKNRRLTDRVTELQEEAKRLHVPAFKQQPSIQSFIFSTGAGIQISRACESWIVPHPPTG